MQIKKLKITNFGKLSDFEITPAKGLNVIYAPNESGKSTLFSFVKYMLYGVKQKKQPGDVSFKEKYMPWNGMPMDGSIDFSIDGTDYNLARRDGGTASKLSVFNITSGEKVSGVKTPGEHFFSFSENAFEASCFVRDVLYTADKSGAGEVMSYLFDSGGEDKLYSKVKKDLEEKILNLSSEKRRNAVIPVMDSKIEIVQSQILNINKQIEDNNAKITEYKKLQNELGILRARNIELLNSQLKDECSKMIADKESLLSEKIILERKLGTIGASCGQSGLILKKTLLMLLVLVLVCNVALSCFFKEALFFAPFVLVLIFIVLHKILKNKAIRKSEDEKTELIKKQISYLQSSIELIEKNLENMSNESLPDKALYTKNFTNGNINAIIKQNDSEIARIETQIRGLWQAEEEKIRLACEQSQLHNELEYLRKQRKKAFEEVEIFNKAVRILELAKNDVKSNLIPELRKNTARIFSDIVCETESGVSFGSEFGVFVNKDGTFRDFHSLSKGTTDALYFSLRLALVEQMSQRGCALPLFIDDSFANLDDERCVRILEIIYKVSQKHQVFMCTCRSREGEYFKNKDNVNIFAIQKG